MHYTSTHSQVQADAHRYGFIGLAQRRHWALITVTPDARAGEYFPIARRLPQSFEKLPVCHSSTFTATSTAAPTASQNAATNTSAPQ